MDNILPKLNNPISKKISNLAVIALQGTDGIKAVESGNKRLVEALLEEGKVTKGMAACMLEAAVAKKNTVMCLHVIACQKQDAETEPTFVDYLPGFHWAMKHAIENNDLKTIGQVGHKHGFGKLNQDIYDNALVASLNKGNVEMGAAIARYSKPNNFFIQSLLPASVHAGSAKGVQLAYELGARTPTRQSGETLLEVAATKNLETFLAILEGPKKLHFQSGEPMYEFTPAVPKALKFAAQYDRLDVVKFIVDKFKRGVCESKDFAIALTRAKSPEVVHALLEFQTFEGSQPLKKGYDEEKRMALENAEFRGDKTSSSLLVAAGAKLSNPTLRQALSLDGPEKVGPGALEIAEVIRLKKPEELVGATPMIIASFQPLDMKTTGSFISAAQSIARGTRKKDSEIEQ